jgi:pimeloyl-ACP methyl ester carboxylesterase
MTAAPLSRTLSIRNGLFGTHVREAGAGAPLLYLHGAEGPLPGWPQFLDMLAGPYRVIAPDLPGFGQSTGGEQLTDVLDLSVYLLDLLDTLGLERVAIVGHDLGGMAAAELAVVAGRRVSALALVAPFGLWVDDDPILDFYATPRDDLTPLAWHDAGSPAATAVLAPPETEEEARLAGLLRNQNLATSTRFLWPIPDRGLKRRIHRVTQPTLLVWGASDRVVPPSYGPRWQQAISGSQLVTVGGAGHFPMLEQPAPTVQAVTEFLAQHAH